jgi:cytochrome c
VLPAGASLPDGSSSELVARGEALWQDGSLSTNGASCSTCHVQNYAQMQSTFADPYPHRVTMVEQMSGVPRVSAAEMVQFCMLQPMQAEPLAWGSPELAALAAYVEHIQPGYQPVAGGAVTAAGLRATPAAPKFRRTSEST